MKMINLVAVTALALAATGANAAATLTLGTAGYTGPRVDFSQFANHAADSFLLTESRYYLPNDLVLDIHGVALYAGLGSVYLDDGGSSDADKVFVGRSDTTSSGDEVALTISQGHYAGKQLGVYFGADGGDTNITALDDNGDEVGAFTLDTEVLGKGEFFAYVTSDDANISRLRISGGQILGVGSDVGAVPEPAAWALMVAGFGLVGVSARRRSPATVAA